MILVSLGFLQTINLKESGGTYTLVSLITAEFLKKLRLTRVSLPVKVILRVAMALQVQPRLLASWTVGERNMVISDIVKEMDFFFL